MNRHLEKGRRSSLEERPDAAKQAHRAKLTPNQSGVGQHIASADHAFYQVPMSNDCSGISRRFGRKRCATRWLYDLKP
jgi:hypothetical protein